MADLLTMVEALMLARSTGTTVALTAEQAARILELLEAAKEISLKRGANSRLESAVYGMGT
jgi:hypothetical protein